MSKNKISIPTATRLPSGKWHVQLRLKDPVTGRTHSVSITKPTQKEAVAEAMAIKAGIVKVQAAGENMLLKDAIEKYISDREHLASPSTIVGYRKFQRNRFLDLQNMRCKDLPPIWQAAVDREKTMVSSKYLKNTVYFIHSVVAECSGIHLTCKLGQVVTEEHAWLDPEQLAVFQDAIRGNPYEVPMLLALSSLRKSEIAAVKWSDINLQKNTITVHGAAVIDQHGNLIDRKENKNETSRRIIHFIIPQLREAVEAQEHNPSDYVYHKNSPVLSRNINRVCQANGLPLVGTHGLRHSYASLCAHMGIPEQLTMKMGGWKDPSTVRKIYTHIANQDMLDAAAKIERFFQNAHTDAYENQKAQQPQGK